MTPCTSVSMPQPHTKASPHWWVRVEQLPFGLPQRVGRGEGAGNSEGTPLGQGESSGPPLRLLSHLVRSLIINVSLKHIPFS